jgi:hypothetical protein
MTMQNESGSLNGQASLYLMIGRIQSDVSHLATGLGVVSEKVQRLERTARRKPEPRAWIQSLGLSGKELLILGWLAAMGITGTITPEQFQKLLFGH